MTSIPIIEMTGPAGRRIINEVDREMWERKGYKVIGSEPAKTDDGGSKTDNEGSSANITVAELRKIAAEKGIDLGKVTKKAEILVIIKKAMGKEVTAFKVGDKVQFAVKDGKEIVEGVIDSMNESDAIVSFTKITLETGEVVTEFDGEQGSSVKLSELTIIEGE